MEYFSKLGHRLEREWSRNRDEESFVEIAQAALNALPPQDGLDLDDWIEQILDPWRAAPRQFGPPGVFGQPGFTAYHGSDFVVDVYFWTNALSAIHNHPFCGVFTVLKGHSLHARYRFEERTNFGPRIRLGKLAMDRLELIEEGHVEPFSLRDHPLIHALVHVPIPSVSMVVRTTRTLGYFRYFPPTFALAVDEPDEAIVRRLALLEMLFNSEDSRFETRLLSFLGRADFETTFRAFSRFWGMFDEALLKRALDCAGERHGEAVQAIPAAMERTHRVHEADALRAELADADDRLVCTALMLAESRDDVLSVLRGRHADPIARLHRFVDTTVGSDREEDVSAEIAHALVYGEGESGAIRRLNARFDEALVREQGPSIATFCEQSPFAALALPDNRDVTVREQGLEGKERA